MPAKLLAPFVFAVVFLVGGSDAMAHVLTVSSARAVVKEHLYTTDFYPEGGGVSASQQTTSVGRCLRRSRHTVDCEGTFTDRDTIGFDPETLEEQVIVDFVCRFRFRVAPANTSSERFRHRHDPRVIDTKLTELGRSCEDPTPGSP